MVIKRLFGKDEEKDREYTIDELIILERWDEAERKLLNVLKVKKDDVHYHLKLAEVYVGLRQVAKAVDEYCFVADQYAADGFHDRASAAISKARRINPMDDTLVKKQQRYEHARALERARTEAMEGFLAGQSSRAGQGTAVIEFQSLWMAISKTELVRRFDSVQLKLFFQAADSVYLDSQRTLVTRDAEAQNLYIVCGGELRAEVEKADGSKVEMHSFGVGDIIGESALFEKKPWPATYVSRGKTILLRLDADGMQKCLVGNPDPRGFLDTLRRQGKDQEVAKAVAQFESRV